MTKRFHLVEAEAWVASEKARLMSQQGKDQRTVDLQFDPAFKAAMSQAMLKDIPIDQAFKEMVASVGKQVKNDKLMQAGYKLQLFGMLMTFGPIVVILGLLVCLFIYMAFASLFH